jgi:hypothetical protein
MRKDYQLLLMPPFHTVASATAILAIIRSPQRVFYDPSLGRAPPIGRGAFAVCNYRIQLPIRPPAHSLFIR